MKKIQEQIIKAAGRLDLWNLFETIPHAVAAIDGELRVMAANGRMRELLSALGNTSDPYGKPLGWLFPSVGEQLENACRKLVESGRPDFTVNTFEQGNGGAIEFRMVAVEPGEDDLRLLLMIPPDPGRHEMPVKPPENEFQKLAENLVDVLFTTDDQARLVYISPQIKQYGYDPQEVLYHQVFEYIHIEDREDTRRQFFNTVLSERGGPYQFRLNLKGGGYEWMEVRARSEYDENNRLKSVSGMLRNISERMELESERARASRLESLELLAGGIAHDFNNLLTSILGGISLARSIEEKTGKASEILGEAEKAVVRAEELTRQLLSFARGSKPVRQVTDIGALIEESVSFNLLGSNVSSRLELNPDLWHVNVDKGQISQVLSNLVINAKQAMPSGGSIAVRAENQRLEPNEVEHLTAGRYVMVSIIDTGVGIAPENLDKVFDPYFTTKSHGTGLGLATVFSILRRHGGTVTVSSKLSAGSEFKVFLPAVKGEVKTPAQPPQRPAQKQGKILIMDDEDEVSSICGKILERAGHRVATCAEGAAALELYSAAAAGNDPFDLVILDLTIPGGMGGVETIRRLKEIDPQVRALVSSGYSNDPVMADPASYGFSAVVPKPYNFEQMKTTVAMLLESER